MKKKEIWRKIKGLEHYEISSKKNIRNSKSKLGLFKEKPLSIKTSSGIYVVLKTRNFSTSKLNIIKKLDHLFESNF